MPPRRGKKKKGKVLTANQADIQQEFSKKVLSNLGSFGAALKLPTSKSAA